MRLEIYEVFPAPIKNVKIKTRFYLLLCECVRKLISHPKG
jgi:hypothetical protein